jgi:tetratricopeptide (TPR) repeat protein
MNDATKAPGADDVRLAVDAEHPWLGLASFSEETRGYFYGREEEVAELCRRVQRKQLTILFGQSGLGKTSILRAGIVPRLRPEGYCPVYVRIDYSPESPVPTEQIKQAIFRATQAAGAWTQPGTAVSGESLWEFLHHRDDVLRDASGKALIPLLIFDQFEELFTLAQSDDFGRQRAAQFIEDLSDLVENRAPKALEAKMDQDESAVDGFDFTRSDYRILIALREDYLAHLEGLKGSMPSISQNRMRLARMTGAQALSAVVKPGGRLVSEEVAGSIVRFVAGGAELVNAEVEPALLSLICRELNNARIAQRRSEISADLLAGSRDTILTEFYERALADQPAGVRQFVEDNLLTESGHRESLAEERVQKGLAAAGAPPDALATLVNRRLLRIEERLDVRRVELTHDVLTGVVKGSRDLRLEREARDAAERNLAAQRAREIATRKALVRARQIATACALLAIVAGAGAVFGYFGMKRAQEAELQAQATRAMAEQARGEAEKLIVYLLDDFYLELEPVGRVDIVGELAKRALDYYRALPPELRTPETERNRALAMVRYGAVLRTQAKLEEGSKVLTEAVGILDGLRAQGDTSEITAIGLGLGLAAQARTADSMNQDGTAAKVSARAVSILEPLMAAPSPSVPLRRAYGNVKIYQGFSQLRSSEYEASVKSLDRARETFRSIDGLAYDDLPSAAGYAEATGWRMEALRSLGRVEEAKSSGDDAVQVASKVLERRPAYMGALRARALVMSNLADIDGDDFHFATALPISQASTRDWESFLKLDPGNTIALNNFAAGYQREANYLYRTGHLAEALEKLAAATAVEKRTRMSPSFAVNQMWPAGFVANIEADRANYAQAEAALANVRRLAKVAGEGRTDPSIQANLRMFVGNFTPAIPVAKWDFAAARKLTESVLPDAGVPAPPGGRLLFIWNSNLNGRYRDLANAAFMLGDYPAAEAALKKSMTSQALLTDVTMDRQRDVAQSQILLAMILARQGKQADAQRAVAPALKLHRELQARKDNQDLTQRIELAQALLASAMAGGGKEAASLAEAAALIDRLPPSLRQLRSTELLRKMIAEEQGGRRKPA